MATKAFVTMSCIAALSACNTTTKTVEIKERKSESLFNLPKDITEQDVLRGSITPERAWWDLQHYTLSLNVDPATKSISGSNVIKYKVLNEAQALQIELQPPMKITKAEQNGKTLEITTKGYSYFIATNADNKIGSEEAVTVYFEGMPKEAIRAPWDGGITWTKDEQGTDFVASANQGIGSSIWWPNKDHGYDEPDQGIDMHVEVPEHLMNISNGRLISTSNNQDRKTKTYHWKVINPINNYGVNINVGDYVHFGETYRGEKGALDMDYYVLSYNLDKAKKQFKEAARTIEAFEHWFGPYPFYEDSFKLVEAPYLGMEHQSSVTYGNGYQNGYLGRDRSQAGPGLLFDFIIVHEAGHEWFANNITAKDVADLWIHESFTNYSESLFLEYHFGKGTAFKYQRGSRRNPQNQKTIEGLHGVHREGSSDMYDKGGNVLHTIRQLVDSDEKWRQILRGLNKEFYHQTVTAKQVERYIAEQAQLNLAPVFDQYIRDARIPMLEYFIKEKEIDVRWANTIKSFDMPIKVNIDGEERWITPTTKWQTISLAKQAQSFNINKEFYVGSLNILGD